MSKCLSDCRCGRHRIFSVDERQRVADATKRQWNAGFLGKHGLTLADLEGRHPISSKVLKRLMLKSGIPYLCSICGSGPEWRGAELVLELDHANGDHQDNSLGNLWFLCPNCHEQRPTRLAKTERPYLEPLTLMWRRQLAFTSLYLKTLDKPIDRLTEEDRIRLTKEYLLSMHSETTEILNSVPWKTHRYIGPTDRTALLEEMVDLQKFLFGLFHIWGVSIAEFERAFNKKSSVVEQRFNQEHILPTLVADRKVVLVDIDGTVANWADGFDLWVERHHRDLQPRDFDKLVNPVLREVLKSELYEGGGMLDLALLDGAKEAINSLIRVGYAVVWLTARPVSKHPRLAGDTVEWLQRSDLPTDYIWYSDFMKHFTIVEKFPLAAALFDDEPEIIFAAREAGIPAFQITAESHLPDLVEEFIDAAVAH